MRWDPAEYLRFADQRGRPFTDLMARVPAQHPELVVDLGCGPGNQTLTLARRWPAAQVVGVDSSAEMVDRAWADHAGAVETREGRLRFELGDLTEWSRRQPIDVLVSNATFQWVPGHLEILEALVSRVRPGGWFAFQVPGNFGAPSHTELAAVRESGRWRERLTRADLPKPAVAEPEVYLQRLIRLGAAVDVWETTYFQVLAGDDAVLRWMQGTGLRPVLSELDDEERTEFLADYAARLRTAYPQKEFGTVLPYRRIFVVAHVGVKS